MPAQVWAHNFQKSGCVNCIRGQHRNLFQWMQRLTEIAAYRVIGRGKVRALACILSMPKEGERWRRDQLRVECGISP